MSWLSWLVVLFAGVLLIPGAYSIEVGFSAENGGEYSSIESSYDVDTDVSVNEESSASPDQAKIESLRTVSGTGDIEAVQIYSGSGGYAGRATLSSQGVSGSLRGTAFLAPQCLTAGQDVSLNGNSVDTGMSLANKGDSANLGVAISSGTIDSKQVIETGSVNNGLSAVLNAPWARISKQTSFQGKEDHSTMTLKSTKQEPTVFDMKVGSYFGTATDLKYCIADLYDEQVVSGKDGSKAEIRTIVTNPAKPYKYKYDTSVLGQISQTLTVEDADYISANAYATNGKGDESSSGVFIKGDNQKASLYGYENDASFDGTSVTSSQKFSIAEGNNIILNRDSDPISLPAGSVGVAPYSLIKGDNSEVRGYSSEGSVIRLRT